MGASASVEKKYHVALHAPLQHKNSLENIIVANRTNTNVGTTSQRKVHLHDSVQSHAVVLHTKCGADMDGNTKTMLEKAFKESIFFSDSNALNQVYLNYMDREYFERNSSVFNEGDVANKMYIVETGKIALSTLSGATDVADVGMMFGEVNILMNTSRSYSAFAVEGTYVWSLDKDVFKVLSRANTIDQHTNFILHISSIPELNVLPDENKALLVQNLTSVTYAPNADIYTFYKPCDKLVIIEQGSVQCVLPDDWIDLTRETILARLGVHTSADENVQNILFEDKKVTLLPGCIVGLAILRGKAGMDYAWEWVPKIEGKIDNGSSIAPITLKTLTEVTCSYITIRKFEELFGRCEFVLKDIKDHEHEARDVHKYEEATPVVVPKEVRYKRPSMFTSCVEKPDNWLQDVIENGKFLYLLSLKNETGLLGQTKFTNKNITPPVQEDVAIKIYAKARVVIPHIICEKNLLNDLEHSFIVKLYESFQTTNEVLFVMEHLVYGDLYYMLHHHPSYLYHGKPSGLPFQMVQFYLAQVISALSYMRRKGLVYRNINPHNLLLDQQGYLRLVDFKYTKKIPYKDNHHHHAGHKYQYKTYTLCGVSEYMAPEMILRTGYDHSVDLWSLGILTYELCTGTNPFTGVTIDETASKIISMKHEPLFDRSVERRPVVLNVLAEQIALLDSAAEEVKNATAALDLQSLPSLFKRKFTAVESTKMLDVITGFLSYQPSHRLSLMKGDLDSIYSAALFEEYDWNMLEEKKIKPMYVPSEPVVMPTDLDPQTQQFMVAFTGSKEIFKPFKE